MKIYTKTGDRGSTALVGGTRVPKTHVRLEAYGTVDELNAVLGWLLAEMEDSPLALFLTGVQHRLFCVGAELATERSPQEVEAGGPIELKAVTEMEAEIDRLNEELPPLKAFVLPGGGRKAAVCHVARTVCRRAERAILRMELEGVPVNGVLKQYMNRLSDYLFVLSRKLNVEDKKSEIFWDNSCK